MSEDIKTAYANLIKIASALEDLENIQHEIGKKHPGAEDNPNAKYNSIEQRFEQPYSNVSESYDRQMNQKVVGADEYEETVTAKHDAAKGLNNRFFYPHSKEFKKSASLVRKSSVKRIKKAGY